MLARRPPTTICLRVAARRHLSTDYHQANTEIPPPSLSTTRPTRPRLSPSPRPSQSTSPSPLTSSATLSSTRASSRPLKLPPTFGRNQLLEVPNSTRALLEEIVGTFRAPIRYAFAYGSGVFEQGGSAGVDKDKKPMLDFMFAVTHPAHWHSINLAQNPHHYPSHAQWLGSDFIAKVQEIGPAAVWFNAFVPISGVTIKYGITTVDNLCSDLLTWKSLYLAGRMHKPLRIIKDDPRVRLTQQVNLTSAVRAALLTLPESFDEKELYQRIAGLSYRGDPRMALPFENRQKVANIVDAQANLFKDVYHRLVVGLPGVHWPTSGSTIQQDMNPLTRASHLRKLPSNLASRIDRHYLGATGIPPKEEDPTVYWTKLAGDPALANVLQNEVQGIVRYPATVQSMKGLVTAGVSSSVKYVGRKVGKWWTSSSTPNQS